MQTRWQRWVRVCWLVPAMYGAGQVGAGARSAEACTGGSPGEDWSDLEVAQVGSERVAIATDGFVLLERHYYGEVDPEAPGVSVQVTDSEGAIVAGQLQVLSTRELGDVTQAYLGWTADEPLALGSVLRLAPSTGSKPTGRSYELEVVGEPAPLPTPSVTLGDWGELRHGIGELTDCASTTSCGTSTLSVPTHEERLAAVRTSWSLPTLAGMVAWEVRAEASEPQNGLETSFQSSRTVGGFGEGSVDTGLVVFANDATDHCVVLVMKDLRSGEERRSEPVCTPDGAPTFAWPDHELSECDEPPTPDSLALWCATRPQEPRCLNVAPSDGGAGGTPSTDEPSEPSPDPENPTRGGASGDAGAGPREVIYEYEDDSGRDERGCQLAPARGNFALLFATLGAAAALVRRRQLTRR